MYRFCRGKERFRSWISWTPTVPLGKISKIFFFFLCAAGYVFKKKNLFYLLRLLLISLYVFVVSIRLVRIHFLQQRRRARTRERCRLRTVPSSHRLSSLRSPGVKKKTWSMHFGGPWQGHLLPSHCHRWRRCRRWEAYNTTIHWQWRPNGGGTKCTVNVTGTTRQEFEPCWNLHVGVKTSRNMYRGYRNVNRRVWL